MSTDHDALGARLQRLGEAVPVTGDPVARVRAEVGRRRRRRRDRAVVGVGVLVVAGALTASLLPGSGLDRTAPPASTPEATESVAADVGIRLAPDGLPGLTLGEAVDPEVWRVGFLDERTCFSVVDPAEPGATPLPLDALAAVQLEDGRVVGLVVHLRADAITLAPDERLQTWLGPTLGSPLAEAVALPGAQAVTEDPPGSTVAPVTSVVVPTDDGEVVFSDAPLPDGSPADGRITLVTVRQAGTGPCAGVRDFEPGVGGGEVDAWTRLDAGGSEVVRLGAPVAPLVEAGELEPADPFSVNALEGRTRSCEAWTRADDPRVIVVSDADGRIVATGTGQLSLGGFSTDFGIEPGQDLTEVEGLFAASYAATPRGSFFGTVADVEIASGVRAEVGAFRVAIPLETIADRVPGELRVDNVVVYRGSAGDPLC